MMDPLAWVDDELSAWAQRGLRRELVALGGGLPGRVEDGAGRVLVNFGSNDYLGLAADPRVVEAARGAASAYGWGAGASPLVSGWRGPHRDLAEALAAFEQTEAAVLFPTGYAANLGTIAALVGPGDVVYSDRLNHACLIDGARLSRAEVRVYRHGEPDHLEEFLSRERGRFRRALIVTDGVFSMDGDLAPLPALVALAEEFEAMLLVDEAHGTGVVGGDGRGAASALGVAERIPIRVGTLSKALGSVGGFVAGSRRLIDWLTHRARPLVFSTALPAAAAAAALEALRIAQSEPWRRQRVREWAERVGGSATPIVPVIVGDPDRTVELARRLRDRGLLVPAIRPPTVPEGTSRLRVSLTAGHTEADLTALLEGLADAGLDRRRRPE